MATLAEQFAALSVLDTLKHSSKPASMTMLPFAVTEGSWTEATGWSPSGYIEGLGGIRSGHYVNTGKVVGSYGVGMKKTTGSLAAAARQFDLWLFFQNTGKISGYQLAVVCEASGKVQYILRKWTGESEPTVLWESAKEQTFAENDSFFLGRVNKNLVVYHRTGEGTPELLKEVEDTTYTEGYIGFGGNGSNPKFINYQAGALISAKEEKDFVRKFTSSPASLIRTALGTAGRTEDVLIAALVKMRTKPAGGFTYTIVQLETVNGARGFCLKVKETGKLECNWLETEEIQTTSVSPAAMIAFNDRWKLIVVRKAAGAKKADFGVYDFVTREWTWEEGNEGAAVKSQTPNAISIGESNGFNRGFGEIAAAMIGPVISRASAEGLAQVGTLYEGWKSFANALWLFGQSAVTEKIQDETGNGANQTTAEGSTNTAVVSETPPIPYYNEVMQTAKLLIANAIKAVKRWTFLNGAVRRY